MLDGPAHVGQAVQPDRDHLRGLQIAGGGQLLAAEHVLMANAGEVDGRALAAMDLVDRLVVILQRAHPHPFAARQPVHLLADLEAAGGHRARDHGAMALDDEARSMPSRNHCRVVRSSTCRHMPAMADFSSSSPGPWWPKWR